MILGTEWCWKIRFTFWTKSTTDCNYLERKCNLWFYYSSEL